MTVPLLLGLAFAQQATLPFSTPLQVADMNRVAISPKLDGKLENEEWDTLALADGIQSFFQWEPGELHAAARLLPGMDMVVSFDLNGDGWLVGKDNIEARVRWTDQGPIAYCRQLDATNRSGPVWLVGTDFTKSVNVAATMTETEWVCELTLDDPGTDWIPTKPGRTIGIRVDAVDAKNALVEPYLPRVVTPVMLAFEAIYSAPTGLKFNSEFKSGNSVIPGDTINLRSDFDGSGDLGLSRIEMRGEGFAEKSSLLTAVPFPKFDGKGRCFVDYNSPIGADATFGFRVMRGTITGGSGQKIVTRISYQVAPIVSFATTLSPKLVSKAEVQSVKFSNWVYSNTRRRVDAVFSVEAPSGWNILNGNNQSFVIYNPRGSSRRVYELQIPGGTKGAFPLKLKCQVGATTVEKTEWITIN